MQCIVIRIRFFDEISYRSGLRFFYFRKKNLHDKKGYEFTAIARTTRPKTTASARFLYRSTDRATHFYTQIKHLE